MKKNSWILHLYKDEEHTDLIINTFIDLFKNDRIINENVNNKTKNDLKLKFITIN